MSGRGKGGKGLGSDAKKRKVGDEAFYKWSAGEEAVVLSYINSNEYELVGLLVPMKMLHKLIVKAVSRSESPCFEWNLDDINSFETLMEVLNPIDIKRFFDKTDTDDDSETDQNDIVESIKEWCDEHLEHFKKAPTVPVQCMGRIVICGDE